jgi:D-galactose 1-dehydrogenase
MFNVGIIGLGHVAVHQMAAIEDSSDFRLIAGCDPDQSRLSLLDHSVNAYTDTEEMLKRSDLDVIVVASPNRLHVTHGLQVMAAGRWLFMEKPLAETQEEFDLFARKRREYAGNCTLALHAAFGVELEWFCRERKRQKADVDELTSFVAELYDPYFNNDQVQQRATSLGGSWMDSGINALSIICRLISPHDLVVCDSRMTRVEDSDCLEVQGTVDIRFSQPRVRGTGVIEVNWTTGRDKKQTTLGYNNGSKTIILDHSGQQVILREQGQDQLLFSCDNGLPRLTNHYVGAFRDLALQMKAGTDNFSYCQKLHRLLFQAENLSELISVRNGHPKSGNA